VIELAREKSAEELTKILERSVFPSFG
jgi:hypothetical protein